MFGLGSGVSSHINLLAYCSVNLMGSVVGNVFMTPQGGWFMELPLGLLLIVCVSNSSYMYTA